MLDRLISFSNAKSTNWRAHTPWFGMSMRIDGVKYSLDEFRLDRRWNGYEYEYRATPLTVEEIYDRKAW